MHYVVNILWTFLVVGVIIFFHELGHFLAAKKVGIKVEKFSIGFGPKLAGFKKGDTEYCISWFPIFGGYVKMAGENPAEEPSEEGEEEEGHFLAAPVLHRAFVAVAGPGMNIVFAVFVIALAYMIGMPSYLVPKRDTTIGYVEPDSPASGAGIMPGDKILSVGGYKTKVWGDIQENVAIHPDKEIEVTLLRNEKEEISLRVIPERVEGYMFSIDLGIQDDLDSSIISEGLRQEFENNGVSLSSDANVQIEKSGTKWLITDEGKEYPIRIEENKLNIYWETEAENIELFFSINLDFKSDLDNGIISEYLKRKFEDKRASLDPDAIIRVEETSKRWLIINEDKKYHIEKEYHRLDIYRETEFGKIGVSPVIKPVIGAVEPDSVAARAGFRPDDVIEAVNQKAVGHIIEFANEFQNASGESINFTVRRNGNTIEIPLALEFDEDGQLKSLGGISFGRIVRVNPISAFGIAIPETIRVGGKIFQFLKRMIIREVPMKYIAGPLGIVQITMAVIKTGLGSTLRFAGFLSVNLGIVNLLPLFITDGGVIVFLIIEKIRGRRMSHKKQLLVQQIGIGFIISLFLLVTYNDVLRLVRGFF